MYAFRKRTQILISLMINVVWSFQFKNILKEFLKMKISIKAVQL